MLVIDLTSIIAEIHTIGLGEDVVHGLFDCVKVSVCGRWL